MNLAYLSLFITVWVHQSTAYITWIAPRLWLQTPPSPPGSPWPMPQQWSHDNDVLTFNSTHFRFVTSLESCDVIDAAIERYSAWMVLDPDASPVYGLELVEGLQIDVSGSDGCESDVNPYDGMDESYELNLYPDDEGLMLLSSQTIWGALKGLETFSQLIYLNDNNENMLNKSYVSDFPRFGYRGLMIDTVRHFLPLNIIQQIIEAMSWDKLNVLHWHIVDDQAFPYESTTFPNMSQYGAYSEYHVYTQDDVKQVIEYARLYGIRVIPEFDTPGHTYSWGKALPDLLTPCWGDGIDGGPYVPKWGEHADMETINPSQQYSYDVIAELLAEVTEVFPDEFVHLGLDEAYHRCWQSNPYISAWMLTMGFAEYSQIEEYYANRLIDIALNLSAKIITWQDPIDNNVTLDTLNTRIGVWKDDALGTPGQFEDWRVYMNRVTEKGYNTYLLAPWYLNYISYGEDWREYYMVDPYNFTDDESLREKVLGGSAAAWAEYIDATNILSLLWPRLSAVAERLWSSQNITDVDEAAYRLDQHRCTYIRRGVPAKPLMPGHCGKFEWGVDPIRGRANPLPRSSLKSADLARSGANPQNMHLLLTGLLTFCTTIGFGVKIF